ncbi:hypothetical protein BY996DRAFT_8684535 [Phakopsora pachyrhizi]|nr:hypothetical protein BY996DRAFT_4626910 [Phakopsora pachyrhizi]KAI8458964.1 hypothetical protein BY996DRAFT_8684535 [Phakopsora pachyrhizi]
MAYASFISFLILFLTSNFFNSSAQLGVNNKDHAVLQRAHHISSKPRLQSAKFEPSYEVSLHYSQSDPSQGYRYVAVVDWYMRVPALVALDQPDIESVQCDWDGIRIKFDSEKGALKARRWQRPMVLVTELKNTMCSYHDQNEEQYHPILLESIAEDAEHGSREVVFDGYRTRWDIVAYDHKVQIGSLAVEEQLEYDKLKFSKHKRSFTAEPNSFTFSPSINFDPQRNLSINPSLPVPIAFGISDQTELSIDCENCYVDSKLKLTIETGSCILDVGLTRAAKIVKSINKAQNALKLSLNSAAKATIEALVSQFNILAEQLSNSLSVFYNCVARASATTNLNEKVKLRKELEQISQNVRLQSQALFTATQTQLYIQSDSELQSREKFLMLQQIKKVVTDTNEELEAAIEIGSRLYEDPSNPDFCLTNEGMKLGRRSNLSRRSRRRGTSINVVGYIKGNIDLKVSLLGKQEVSTGDLSLLSVSLLGIQIPGVLTIGPQVRMIVNSAIGIQGYAKLDFGADFEWSNLDANINGKGDTKNCNLESSNFRFNKHPTKFDFKPMEFYINNHFKAQIGFGIDFSLGKQELMVGLEGNLGFAQTLNLPRLYNPAGVVKTCPGGLNYEFNLTSQLNAFVTTPTFTAPFLQSLAGPLIIPLWQIDPIQIFQHCFQLPKTCYDILRTPQKSRTLTTCPRILSSINL